MEVCPLSREVMSPYGSTSIRLVTRRHSLSPLSCTRNSFGSSYDSLSPDGESYGLTVFRVTDDEWVRLSLSAGGVGCP